MNPHSHGNPNSRWAAIPSATVSTRHGENASLKTTNESRRRAEGSRPKPARISITVRAICLERTHIATGIISINSYIYSNPYSHQNKTEIKKFKNLKNISKYKTLNTQTSNFKLNKHYLLNFIIWWSYKCICLCVGGGGSAASNKLINTA